MCVDECRKKAIEQKYVGDKKSFFSLFRFVDEEPKVTRTKLKHECVLKCPENDNILMVTHKLLYAVQKLTFKDSVERGKKIYAKFKYVLIIECSISDDRSSFLENENTQIANVLNRHRSGVGLSKQTIIKYLIYYTFSKKIVNRTPFIPVKIE